MDTKLRELNSGELHHNIFVMYILFRVLFYSEIAKTMIEQVKEYLNERPREIQENFEDWNDDDWSNR